MSLPSRERGLKYNEIIRNQREHEVAPFTGAWIEIEEQLQHKIAISGRSLHGSVD